MREITKKYSNGDVTIVWKPSLCIHSGICFMGLPDVFKPRERPWVTPEESTTDEIIRQVNACPSGALSYFMNATGEEKAERKPAEGEPRFEADDPNVEIEVKPTGPLLVKGVFTIVHKDGRVELREKNTSLCRCGHSKNKPFCDASHKEFNFEG